MTQAPMMSSPAASDAPLLDVQNLSVHFVQGGTRSVAVDRISFAIRPRETVALVGESGSGKSVTALSVLKLLPYPPAEHPTGRILFNGTDLLSADEKTLRSVRGNKVTMIFQEPMSSLNPLHTIERQIGEVLLVHQGISGKAARKRILELLEEVGIRDAAKRLDSYPHQLSGGQRQRVMIAMALANEPELLIADEPTTALDVTVQAQILKLLKDIQERRGMALLFITHDLGIVRKIADRVCVMTKGHIVETGPTREVFANPQHEYTRHLLAAEPRGRPRAADPAAAEIVATDDLKVWFPIKAGLFRRTVDYVKAVDGIDISVRPISAIPSSRRRSRRMAGWCGRRSAIPTIRSTTRWRGPRRRRPGGACRWRSAARPIRSAPKTRTARSAISTGSAPTIRAATCWRAASTAFASRSCSASS